MQNFLIDIYTIGYKSAVEQINPSIKSIDESAVERAIKELIRKEFGIGEKRYSAAGMEQKIKEALDGSFEDLDVAEISVKLDEKRREL
jgi:diketogulonate reductase-like aldo/keto reductase